MRPAIATVCSLEASLETILDDYAAGHVDAIDLWLGHADAFVKEHGVAVLKGRLTEQGIAAVAASFQGGLLTSQGEARREHWSHFDCRLALCRDLGIPVLVVAGDVFDGAEAGLDVSPLPRNFASGRRGHHSEHLGHLLCTMQYLPRAYPDAQW